MKMRDKETPGAPDGWEEKGVCERESEREEIEKEIRLRQEQGVRVREAGRVGGLQRQHGV